MLKSELAKSVALMSGIPVGMSTDEMQQTATNKNRLTISSLGIPNRIQYVCLSVVRFSKPGGERGEGG